jgi:hypothetical protein
MTYLLLNHSASDINGLVHTPLALPEPMTVISTNRNIMLKSTYISSGVP